MVRMVVTYRGPQDQVAFDRDYFGVHVPLAQKLPGLQRYVVSKAHLNATRADDDAYLIATLDFDSQAALDYSASVLFSGALTSSSLPVCRATSITVAPRVADTRIVDASARLV